VCTASEHELASSIAVVLLLVMVMETDLSAAEFSLRC
jgi:hypothetical protein